ncbi:MAG: LamG domain-containing protein [Candidatus Competibacteraceae bacterium]|nr:LamG domain-containing protein [Candidatus Competibacteraceae bacterium]
MEAPGLIRSVNAAEKIVQHVQNNNALSIEAWIKPANTSQDGPARIITFSSDPDLRNFTVGQGLWGDQPASVFDVRLRTTETDLNGQPSLTTAAGTVQVEPTHLVYRRDGQGNISVYVNGLEALTIAQAGGFDNWDERFALALGNELDGSRAWLGEIYLVAIYDRALTNAEIAQNYRAGYLVAAATPEIESDSQTAVPPTASPTAEIPASATTASGVLAANSPVLTPTVSPETVATSEDGSALSVIWLGIFLLIVIIIVTLLNRVRKTV